MKLNKKEKNKMSNCLKFFLCTFFLIAAWHMRHTIAFVASPEHPATKKVAVIGAGLAGLTAAYRLTQQGLDVDLFEARSRVGGRVFTILMENDLGKLTEVELGGQNICDGGEAHNIVNLAKELNLPIGQKRVSNPLQLVHTNEKQDYYHNLLANHHKNIDDLDELIDKAANIGHLVELFCQDNTLLKYALLSRVTSYEGIDAYKQSIYHNIETLKTNVAAKRSAGSSHFIEGGNVRLAMELAKSFANKIHYNHVLKKITVHDSSATLAFEDQSVLEYDYVVLAIPAMIYKDVDFSEARIDNNRLKKIESISYGENYKIALPLNFAHAKGIYSLIKENAISWYNHDNTIKILYIFKNNEIFPNIDDFINVLSKACNRPFSLPSRAIVQACDKNYEVYRRSVYHNWKEDKYAQGSYSGYSTRISEELDHVTYHEGITYKSLFAPINDVLFFAGEHTTLLSDCIGTMEGAVESGERIASAIIKDYKK